MFEVKAVKIRGLVAVVKVNTMTRSENFKFLFL